MIYVILGITSITGNTRELIVSIYSYGCLLKNGVFLQGILWFYTFSPKHRIWELPPTCLSSTWLSQTCAWWLHSSQCLYSTASTEASGFSDLYFANSTLAPGPFLVFAASAPWPQLATIATTSSSTEWTEREWHMAWFLIYFETY